MSDQLYSLECDRAMRALMADNDTSADNCALDDDGKLIWVPVSEEPHAQEKPKLTPVTGSYAHVSAVANRLNVTQERIGKVGWIFSPAPIERLAA